MYRSKFQICRRWGNFWLSVDELRNSVVHLDLWKTSIIELLHQYNTMIKRKPLPNLISSKTIVTDYSSGHVFHYYNFKLSSKLSFKRKRCKSKRIHTIFLSYRLKQSPPSILIHIYIRMFSSMKRQWPCLGSKYFLQFLQFHGLVNESIK